MPIADGSTYAPKTSPADDGPVIGAGEFNFAVAFLDHGHINGQTSGLLGAGATLRAVFDPDRSRVDAFVANYPGTQIASSFDELLADDSISMIASAAVPRVRAAIGERVLRSGKHYFTDKSPFTTLEQLESVRKTCRETDRRYFVYYAERLHNEAAWRAGELVAAGAVGRVLQVVNLAPHRLSKGSRPDWFFDKRAYGGILTDIGSHQVEQFLTYSGCNDATVNFARVDNFSNRDQPGLEDFGELSLTGDNGASFYTRVDWFTPDGMPVWGDGRSFILGTDGSLEVRKYVDPGVQAPAGFILKADSQGVERIECVDQVGYPFFGQMILDALHGSEIAMSQAHIFKAAEISMRAQLLADERN
ncbi:MAG: gfo/Idh/MocA family oxidoreductase [Pseudomonadales bacterium]|nr:gfo/Idh/MocA family oxidoreductase [Pseudomonadales bacterium]